MAGISEGVRLPPGKSKKDCEDLYENFVCMFGEAIDADVILTILESKNWDVEQAAEDLMKLQADFSEESAKKDMGSGNSSPKDDCKKDFENLNHSFSYVYNASSGSSYSKAANKDDNSTKLSGSEFKFNDSWSRHVGTKSNVDNSKDKNTGSGNDISGWTIKDNWKKNFDLTKSLIDEHDKKSSSVDRNRDEESEDDADSGESEDDFDDEEEKENGKVKNVNQVNGIVDDDDDADVIIEEENEFLIEENDENAGFLTSDSLNSKFHSLSLTSSLLSRPSMAYFDRQTSLPFLNDNKKESSQTVSKLETETKIKPNSNSSNKKVHDVFLVNYKLTKKIKSDFDRIYSLAVNGVKVMVLMRGCPGSGKSYTAGLLIKKVNESGAFPNKLHLSAHIFSTDDYFISKHSYNFDPSKLPFAHEWNRTRVEKALSLHRSPVIIDNTNTQLWEMESYVSLGVSFGYHIETLEPDSKWKFHEHELWKHNLHGVPKKQIRNMLDRYERNVNGEKLLKLLKINYPSNLKPPQPLPSLNICEETKEKKKRYRKNKKKQPVANLTVLELSEPLNKKVQNELNCKMVNDKVVSENKNEILINQSKKPFLSNSASSVYSFGTPSKDNIDREDGSVDGCMSAPLKLNSDEFQNCTKNLDAVIKGYNCINELYSEITSHDLDTISFNSSEETNFSIKVNESHDEKTNIKSDIGCFSVRKFQDNENEMNMRLDYVEPSNVFYENYQLAKTITNDFERVFMLILNKVKILVLLRGCPGSGKTYLANRLIDGINASKLFINKLIYKNHVLSADDYFISSDDYFFCRQKLSEAHSLTEKRGQAAIENNVSPVIIDNCNVDISDMKSYVEVAVKHGYVVEVLEPDSEWKFNEDELLKRNIHGVIRMKIRYMLDKYEKDITGEKLLKTLNLNYPRDKSPPQTAYDTVSNFFASNNSTVVSDFSITKTENIHETVTSNEVSNHPEKFEFLTKNEGITSNNHIEELVGLSRNEEGSSSYCGNSTKNTDFVCELLMKTEDQKELSQKEENYDVQIETINEIESIISDESFLKIDKLRICPIYQTIREEFKIDLERICILILCNVKVLIFLRGFYATGKTCTAHLLIEKLNNLRKTDLIPLIYFDHVINDDNKKYTYLEYLNRVNCPSLRNQVRVEDAMKNNINPVIIDSCNIKLCEMKPFVKMAVNYGYIIEVLEPDSKWRFDESELVKRSIFNSAEEAQNWLKIYERDINGRKLLDYFDLKYNPELLPQIDQNLYLSVLKVMYPVHSELKQTKEEEEKLLHEIYETVVNDRDPDVGFIPNYEHLTSENKPGIIGELPKSVNILPQKPSSPVDILKKPDSIVLQATCSNFENSQNNNVIQFNESQSLNKNEKFILTESFEDEPSSDPSSLPKFTCIKSEANIKVEADIPAENENVGEQISEDNSLFLNTCKEFILLQDSKVGLHANVESCGTIKEDIGKVFDNSPLAGPFENSSLYEQISKNLSTDPNLLNEAAVGALNKLEIDYSDINYSKNVNLSEDLDIFNKDLLTVKASSKNLSNDEKNKGAKNDFERCSSEKQKDTSTRCQHSFTDNTDYIDSKNTLKEEELLTAKKELEKVNVIEWLTENKKSDSEVDMKNINTVEDKGKSFEFSSSWKSWETPETLPEGKKNTNNNVPKPVRSSEKQRKSDSSNSGATGLQTKPKKVPKEFLGWSTVPDPRSDWFANVKDTISGTNNNDVMTPKPPRNLSSHIQPVETNADVLSSGALATGCSPLSSQSVESKQCNEKDIHEGLVNLIKNLASSDASTKVNDSENCEKFNEEEEGGGNVDYSSEILLNMFPHVASVYLKDLLEKCHGDINWAAEILLEENHSENVHYTDIAAADITQSSEVTEDLSQNSETSNSNVNEYSPGSDQNMRKVKKGMFTKSKKFIKGNANELKKIIEQSIVLNASSYSENILKLIRRRRGENISISDMPWEMLPDEKDLFYDKEKESKMNDQEEDTSPFPVDNEDEENAVGGNYYLDEDEGTLDFTFSKDQVSKLHENFGSPCLPKNMFDRELVVELPKSLSRQIYSYVMDSIQLQMEDEYSMMEKMISEDEEFARRLQELENLTYHQRNSTPNLQEIIDMETALAIYKADVENDKEKRESNETFAARLGKSILLEKFPNVDQRALLELFSANRNSLHDTIVSLNQDGEMNLNDWERQLLEKAKQESIKDSLPHHDEPVNHKGSPKDERQLAVSDYEYFREEAAKHHSERNECFNKAKEAYNQGNKNAASYYSQLANLHLQQIEYANSRAATALLSAHDASSEVTLDLHFYKVKESLEVLDLFLDSAINRLKEKQKNKVALYIITGRGLHSTNGRSKLRPAIINKLKSRQLSVSFINPGMLRVHVFKSSPVSSNL